MLFKLLKMFIVFLFSVVLLILIAPLSFVLGGLQRLFEIAVDYLIRQGEGL